MDGILLVDKPRGITSHDVVDFIRTRCGLEKVGHAGTLDPMATGLLVILVGGATKKANFFLNDDKTYRAKVVFGIATDTGDSDGKIIANKDCSIKEDEVKNILKKFEGEIEQIPPMFSAKRHRGKKLYEYARIGIEIKRYPRKVIIKKIEILGMNANEIMLEICCSKGTYIRQLAMDMGNALNYGAHITELRRIKSGNFRIDEAVGLDDIDSFGRTLIYENLIRC